MPNNEYYEYYGPDYELDVKASNMTDHNTPKYLDKLKEAVFEMLRDKDAAPSVPLQCKLRHHVVPKADRKAIPRLSHDADSDDEGEDEEDKDERITRQSTCLSL
jgi:histone deacetylase 1/2